MGEGLLKGRDMVGKDSVTKLKNSAHVKKGYFLMCWCAGGNLLGVFGSLLYSRGGGVDSQTVATIFIADMTALVSLGRQSQGDNEN